MAHTIAKIAIILALAAGAQAFLACPPAEAQDTPVPVAVDNFTRAVTDHYFKKRVELGCFGQFCHDREPTPIDRQPIIRMNRDTPYSAAIFDLTAPVTIVKPDTKGRFQSILVINEDHYLQRAIYEPGTYTFTREEMGTRYIQVVVRTFVSPNDPKDIAELHQAQDGLKVSQASRGSFEVPNWDQARLELHGPPLPAAAADPRRHLEVPGSPAGPVNAMETPFSAKGK
jgi:hypothetical protein